MGEGASSVLGAPPPPHGRGGLLRFGTTEAPAACVRGPLPFGDHQGPRRMDEGASSVLGPPRPPLHGRGGLFRFGTNEAPAAWARGPLPLWDH